MWTNLDLQDGTHNNFLWEAEAQRPGAFGVFLSTELERKVHDPHTIDLSLGRQHSQHSESAGVDAEETLANALQISEARYRALFEGANDAIFLESIDDKILDVNERACELLGYTRAELLNMQVSDLQAPEARGHAGNTVRSELERYGARPFETVDLRKDGTLLAVEVTNALIQDGQRQLVISIVRDISDRKAAEHAQSRRANELAALFETSLDLNSQLDLPALLRAIVARAAGLVGARMGGLYLLRPDSQSLELVVSHNMPVNYTGAILRLGEGLSGRVAQLGRPLVVQDYSAWPDRAPVYAEGDFRRVLGVPLRANGQLLGVINVTSDQQVGPFSEDEIRLVSLFADQAAIAIVNSRLYAEAQRRTRELAAIVDLTMATTGVLRIDELLARLYNHLQQLVELDSCVVALYDEAADEMRVGLAMEAGRPIPAVINLHLPLEQAGLTGWVMRQRQSLLVGDITVDPLPTPPRRTGQIIRAWLGVPLVTRDQLVGAISVQSFRPQMFTPDHCRLLESLAGHMAVAIHNAQLFEEGQRHDAILKTMAYAGGRLLSIDDLSVVLPDVLGRLGQAAGVDRVYVFENHPGLDGAPLTSQRYEWTAAGQTPQIDNPLLQNLPYAAILTEGQVAALQRGQVFSGLARAMPAPLRALLEAQDIQSIALVPIHCGDTWWGAVGFDDCHRARRWQDAEIEALRGFAGILGSALARRASQSAEREQRVLAEALRDTAMALSNARDLNELMGRVLANVERVVPSDAATIMLIENGVARIAYERGYAERRIAQDVMALRFPIDKVPNLHWMAEHKLPLLIADVWAYPGWVEVVETRWIRSYAAVPIQVMGVVVGFLNLDSEAPGFFLPAHAQRLQAFAGQVGIALENTRLLATVKEHSDALQRLSVQLIQAHEAERKRLSRELHDELGQALTALRIDLASLDKELLSDTRPRTRERLTEAIWLVERTLDQVRDLALDLRPSMLDDLGLAPTVRWYVYRFAQRLNLTADFDAVGLTNRLPTEIETVLYRAVQEGLTNIARHAAANRVQVVLAYDGAIARAQIWDDGRGFDPHQIASRAAQGHGIGLLGLQERIAALGGYMTIRSAPGEGTGLHVEIPVTSLAWALQDNGL
jgi:PAS domain S-box-containing protein